ncbi:hypothetical protein NO932_03705 [Pelagibacterium sp. 26DY04]|uniref:hypothetical protein n=1 Tax=Pelagibacterium sp. 26DY04 TaxID=2967130 RepID=UPI002814B27B|nr:hypothetical protein [Pelagibacterium sp. 26DY04]WMT87725.1 hypothetical protein NO932_03705 [Pelagibacterium sp. 26DY04]
MKHSRIFAVLASALLAPGVMAQETPIFSQATETVEELVELYGEADEQCRLSPSRDVKIAVACHSRTIYGAALNERGWCYGRESQANAEMIWHKCTDDSMHFPPLDFEVW